MISKTIAKKLNEQIKKEAMSSQQYLAMASWADVNGLIGTSAFLYRHSDEERMHMLKLIKFINERGGQAKIPALEEPVLRSDSIQSIFENLLEHEISVTEFINEVVDLCLKEKDHITNNFMQWYVAEQMEEEALARTILDKIKMIGKDTAGLYLLDQELAKSATVTNVPA